MRKSQVFHKPYRVKKRRPVLKSRFFWLSVLFLVLFFGIFYLIFFFSFFQVKEIKISGNEKVSTKDIEDIIKEQIGKKFIFWQTKSIFLVNSKKINKILLEKFPHLEDVNIKRKLSDGLLIEVKERKAIGQWCLYRETGNMEYEAKDENCYLFDENGVIFEQSSEKKDLLIRTKTSGEGILLGQRIIEKENLDLILKIKKQLNEELKIDIKEFAVISSQRLNTKTSDGWEIYFNLKKDMNLQILKLKAVLENKIPPEKRKELKYIDLRFEKIYIFPEKLLNSKNIE